MTGLFFCPGLTDASTGENVVGARPVESRQLGAAESPSERLRPCPNAVVLKSSTCLRGIDFVREVWYYKDAR